MPASRARSCRSTASSRAGPSSCPAAAAAIASALQLGPLQLGEALLELGNPANEALDLSIARVRCSSSGRGPRRCSGPGASLRSVTLPRRGRDAVQHGTGGSGPECHHRLPALLCLPVRGEGGKLALPQRDPVARQLVQAGAARFGRIASPALAHASSILLIAAARRPGPV